MYRCVCAVVLTGLRQVRFFLIGVPILVLALAGSASPQFITGTITGTAMDSTDALIPGVEVSLDSPAMIGGVRTAVTGEGGVYRFTLLPAPGVYRLSFVLPGFQTLNIDGVNLGVGATMTINGTLEVGVVTQELTVTSETPGIDLESAALSINFDKHQLDTLPFQNDIKGIGALLPGSYQTQFDVGGSSMGNGAGTSTLTHGLYRRDQTTYDGVFYSTIFPDYDTYEAVQISAAAKGAEAYNSGKAINFVIKSGGNDFHGAGVVAWQDGSFQSTNVTPELLDQGFSTESTNRFTRYNDVHFDLGGPIVRDKLWFYASYFYKYSGQLVPGFVDLKTENTFIDHRGKTERPENPGDPATYWIRTNGPTLKLTGQLTENTNLDFVAQLTRKIHAHWDASPFHPLEATRRQEFYGMVGPKLHWTYIVSPDMTVDAMIARGGFWWPNYSYTDDVRRSDLTTGHTRGMWGRNFVHPQRYNWSSNWSWFSDIGGKNHEIKSGYMAWWDKRSEGFNGYTNQQIYRFRSRPGDTDLFLRPHSVQVWDYPNFRSRGSGYASWFLTDRISWNRHLKLNIGIRYDRTSSWLPEQGNLGIGQFATKSVFPERRDFPVYSSWVPRFSMVYDVTGEGTLALKASYGRYAIAGPLANRVNPNTRTRWTYSNWDGSIPYVPNPEDLSSVNGGGVESRLRLDPNLKHSFLDEYSAGIELGLSRDSTFRFNVVKRFEDGGFKILDLAHPYEAWTDVVYAVDPGRDNIEGTDDDGVIQAWSVPRSFPTFGKIDRLFTNVDREGNEGNKLYTAYDMSYNKRFADNWSLSGSYAATFSKRRTASPQNPNALIYPALGGFEPPIRTGTPRRTTFNFELPEWAHIVRINGTYDLPWGLTYAGTYFAQSGEYYPRRVLMRNALNSLVSVPAEGRGGRYDWVKMWDSRIVKTFQINDTHSIEARIDFYNLLNTSVVLNRVTTNGPDFGKPLAQGGASVVPMPIIPPRVFRLGMRWRF